MAVEEAISNSGDILGEVVLEVGRIGLWLQTLGIIVILWILFQAVNFFLNRKKRKELYRMSDKLDRIERKIDKLAKSKKRK